MGAVVPVQTETSRSKANVASGHQPIIMLNTTADRQTHAPAVPQRRLP